MASAKTRSIALWTLSIVLALAFLASGASKLADAEAASGLAYHDQFVAWGYPAWARFIVGTAEVLGALALLMPRVRFFGAAGLTLLMLGAAVTHLRVAEYTYAPIPLVLAILTATVAWITRPERSFFFAQKPVVE